MYIYLVSLNVLIKLIILTMNNLKEAHYFHIPSQGNIYSLTDIKLSNGHTIVLIASLKREIFYFEYIGDTDDVLVPTTKEVSFTYIPSGAEIISLNAFNKSSLNNEFVIGITFIKNSNDSDTLETFLNIYSQSEDHEDFNIEDIAQNCLTIGLNFIPYKLTHTELVHWNNDGNATREIVFVLSGSDNMVHVYHEDTSQHIYKELETKERFPEFGKTPSPVLWIDFYHINNYTERITSFACDCGYVKLLKIDTRTNKIIYNMSTRFGNSISSIQLYADFEKPTMDNKNCIDPLCLPELKPEKRDGRPVINLVVVNTILPPVLFCHVLKYGLSDYHTLPRLDDCTVLSCCTVANIDFCRKKEILIGTSSDEILLYKYDTTESKWYLEELKHIAAPILCVKHLDLTGDGVRELVVFSMKGLHVFQLDQAYVQRMLYKKMDNCTLSKISVL
ncbi:KICSTOR complex protein kaptin-like [Rhynchophorus ferrugineus]|uniref:KICSTOR complex protein kaptin-like n=1 Tax=Rhynchophorus ferrugineus TaxID=354439 RepID=UPI003FCE1192